MSSPSDTSPNALPRIKVRRDWLGAPAGTLTNPTCWLFVASWAILSAGTAGYLLGHLPAAATIAVNGVAIYMVFTVMHDSMHRTAHRSRFGNDLLGRLSALPLTITMPLFRAVHYEHHSHTNDPERDPDLVVARNPRWALPLWCLGVVVAYRRHYYGRRMWRDRSELFEALTMEAFLLAAIVVGIATGNFVTLAVVWLVPAMIAVATLALFLDFLPHYPYASQERYLDTRIYPGRLLNALLFGQNYHLVHHLWTTVPWFRYQRVFNEIEPELVARGARIEWRKPANDHSGSLNRFSA